MTPGTGNEPTSGTIKISGHDMRTAREAALAQPSIVIDSLSFASG
jgi:ABC-2 type transport system ATP-binding protein